MSVSFWVIASLMSVAAIAALAWPSAACANRPSKSMQVTFSLVPIFAITFYAWIGSPAAVELGNEHQGVRSGQQLAASSSREDGKVGSVASMLDGLKRHLEENPEDGGSWLLLAKSYEHLGRDDEAAVAYRRAASLGESDSQLKQALGDELIANDEIQSPTVSGIRGVVILSESAQKLVQADDTLFIFAKSSEDQRMPLAALRKTVRDLPIQFQLTNDDAMIAGTQLTDYDEVVVSAKISRTGLATDVLAGMEATSFNVSTNGEQVVSLTISGDSNSLDTASDDNVE